MSSSILTLHWQGLSPWARDWIKACLRNGGEIYVVLINPPSENPFEGLNVRVLGRVHPDDHERHNQWIRDGNGIAFYDEWDEFYQSRSYVYAWLSPNEPQPMQDLNFVKGLNAFCMAWAYEMHQCGYLVGGLQTGVGWPNLGYEGEVDRPPGASDVPYLAHAYKVMDLWTFHEYGWPFMQNDAGYNCLRYRETVSQLAELGVQRKPIHITECGLDGLLAGGGPSGYQDIMPFSTYFENLQWYEEQCQKDNVASLSVFTAAAADPWGSYEVREPDAFYMAEHIAANPPTWEKEIVPPPIILPPYVSMEDELAKYREHEPWRREGFDRMVVHHSAGPAEPADVKRHIRAIARIHRSRDLNGMAYHFVIDAYGIVYGTSNIHDITFHSGRTYMNNRSIGVCMLGNFQHANPTDAQIESMKRLIAHYRVKLTAHKKVIGVNTACPGNLRRRWWPELVAFSQNLS